MSILVLEILGLFAGIEVATSGQTVPRSDQLR